MIVLDLLRSRLPDIPVLFLDTGYHFAETYAYRDRMAKAWNLNVRNLAAKQSVPEQESQFGILIAPIRDAAAISESRTPLQARSRNTTFGSRACAVSNRPRAKI